MIQKTNSPPLDLVLSRLDHVREVSGGFSARCPAHEDHNASLSISIGDDERILVHCHANCEIGDVLKAAGLATKDLFPQTNGHASGNGNSRIVATYAYKDESGATLFEVCRFDPKDFRQRKPKEGGGWDWKTKGVRKVPYRLPELLAAPAVETVFVAEGEKDVGNLVALGLVATCNAGGAGKWRKEYNKHLRGRRVALLPDKDNPGREHAEQVAAMLYGTAADVRIVELSGAGKDASDWIAAGGTKDELLRLAKAAPIFVPKPKADESTDPEKIHFTDCGNGRQFAEDHGADVRFCHPRKKWYAYNGKFWSLDERGEITAKAKATIGGMFARAAAMDGGNRARLLEHALDSEQMARLNAMVTAAQSEPGIPIVPAEMDCDSMLLNTLSGTVDLRTGELRPHSRADAITRVAPVEYATGAGDDCPIFQGFIADILDNQPELIQFIQRLLGYCLTGDVREQIVTIFWGSGSNGKSTLLELILYILGEYALQAPRGLLDQKRGESHPTELVSLFRRRLVTVNETDSGREMAEGLVKQVSGGDQITARGMREDFWSFPPTHKVIMATNHRPAIKGTDHAIWRRIRLVPFTVRIPDERQDKGLSKKLQAEAPAILRWLVAGCLAWQRDGLGLPEQVKAATEEYRASEDVLGSFIENCCVVESHASCPATQLFEAYRDYSGDRETTQTKFGCMLGERGLHSDRYTAGKHKGRKGWWGIGLQAESEQSEYQ